jgi:hypothetical protein
MRSNRRAATEVVTTRNCCGAGRAGRWSSSSRSHAQLRPISTGRISLCAARRVRAVVGHVSLRLGVGTAPIHANVVGDRPAATSSLPPRSISFVPSYNKYPNSYSFEVEVKRLSRNQLFYNTPPGSGVPLFCPPQPNPSDPEGTGRTSLPPTVLT